VDLLPPPVAANLGHRRNTDAIRHFPQLSRHMSGGLVP
jgi:hypothetical protein